LHVEWAQRLRRETDIDNGYRRCGGIEVFESGAETTSRLWQTEGIEFQPLNDAATRELEPSVRIASGSAYSLPGMAQVRNPWHLRALVAACDLAGVRIEPNTPVVRWRTSGSRIHAAIAENGTEYLAGKFLVASGAWSERLLAPLGVRPGVHPVRGQMVLYHPPTPLLRRVIGFGKRYLVPREDGRILVGSTEEPEAGFEKRTTESGVAGLREFAEEVVPVLNRSSVERTWAGLRPGTSDGLPFLGPIPAWENGYVAAGHFRSGIQLSPGTARIVADLLRGRPAPLPIDAFRLDRPPGQAVTTPFRS